MPPQLPNPAGQAAQRAIAANELARSQQLSRDLAARRRRQAADKAADPRSRAGAGGEVVRSSARTSAGRPAVRSSPRTNGASGAAGLFLRVLAFVAFLVILALIVKTGITIVTSHPGP